MKKNDLIGQRFGKLTVIKAAESTQRGRSRWVCRCDCGKECTVLGLNLRRGHTASCGCSRENDLTGQRIGKLTVLCRSDIRTARGARTTPAWECRCDCGNTVYQATDSLTRSCYHMCARCRELYATEKARENAGFVGGTQLSRIKNMNAPSTNTSGVRGVYYDKKSNKWRARLKFKGKNMNFGSYEKFEDAVAARKKAEEEYFQTALDTYLQVEH
ncbi:MAG: hypothetical protein Q3985_05185 [Eubacteriales bacterium]|nr:hypothetical protein [Eubacteriales bacterium]